LGADKILHEAAKTTVVSFSGVIRFGKIMSFLLEFNGSFAYAGRLPAGHLAAKARTIRFVGLPFTIASRGGKARTIRFVGWPFTIASRGGRCDAVSAITNAKVQMPN